LSTTPIDVFMIIRLYLFHLLLLPFVLSAGYGNCPYGCQCRPHHSIPSAWKAECFWEALPDDSPFAVSSSIVSLSIRCSSSSKGRSLSPATLKGLHQMHSLSIHKCQVTTIEKDTFKRMEELKELILTEMAPPGEAFLLPDEVLAPLSRLHSLQLSDSGMDRLPSSFFCSLPHLQMLNLSGNALSSSSFASPCIAANVIILDLSRNRISELLASTLDIFPAVRQLFISLNSISSVHSLSFNRTTLLQQLDVEGNSLTSIGVLPETIVSLNGAYNSFSTLPPSILRLPNLVFFNMSHNALGSPISSLQSDHLETLDLSFNGLSEIPAMASNRTESTLVHFDISHNKIASIEKEDLEQLRGIQTLNLRSNVLSEVGEDSFVGLKSLVSLDLSHNRILLVSPSSFTGLTFDQLQLSHNKLDRIPPALSHMSKCKSIDLSSNLISSISNNIFSKIPQLETINLSDNRLEKIAQFEFSDCAHLTALSLSHNSIREMAAHSFVGCPSLRRLDLSLNRLPSLSLSSSSLSSLRHLNISSNLLMSVEWESLPSRVEHLHIDHNRVRILKGNAANHRCRVLSLSHNSLTSLSPSLLPDSIEYLDVSYNSIASIAPSTFSSKSSLSSLNLGWNALRSLSLNSINIPDVLSSVAIRIQGNPLDCSCEMDWMVGKSSSPHLSVIDLDESECTHLVHGKRQNMTTIDASEMLCAYNRTCGSGCNCCAFSSCDCKSDCPRGCQ
ncbi:hypothetical protein PMAYCL1PPCAC_05210, partial [Pristionchus mayeri]